MLNGYLPAVRSFRPNLAAWCFLPCLALLRSCPRSARPLPCVNLPEDLSAVPGAGPLPLISAPASPIGIKTKPYFCGFRSFSAVFARFSLISAYFPKNTCAYQRGKLTLPTRWGGKGPRCQIRGGPLKASPVLTCRQLAAADPRAAVPDRRRWFPGCRKALRVLVCPASPELSAHRRARSDQNCAGATPEGSAPAAACQAFPEDLSALALQKSN